jgi:hypothetical protein
MYLIIIYSYDCSFDVSLSEGDVKKTEMCRSVSLLYVKGYMYLIIVHLMVSIEWRWLTSYSSHKILPELCVDNTFLPSSKLVCECMCGKYAKHIE